MFDLNLSVLDGCKTSAAFMGMDLPSAGTLGIPLDSFAMPAVQDVSHATMSEMEALGGVTCQQGVG